MRETIQRKLRSVEDQKADTEGQRDTLRSQITALEKGPQNYIKSFQEGLRLCN